jgi:two-component system sensor histidine kinase QseC
VRRGLLPLRRLGTALGRRSPEATQPLVLAESADELHALVDALNSLFARIGRLIDMERRFTADAAHELRTPIAAIRAQAQVALAAEDDASRHHALSATLRGCDRLTRLVEQLLVLSRLDARPPTDHRSVDLAALARRTIAELAPQALERRQTVALEVPRHCEVAADEMLLAVLLRNLVDNAIRYSPAGAQVTMHLTARDGRWHLAVDDSGPGLADAELGRLGERFFRVLGSGKTGSGLGWSIVRRIAEVLALRVEARRSTVLGGLCVEVEGALNDEPDRRQAAPRG